MQPRQNATENVTESVTKTRQGCNKNLKVIEVAFLATLGVGNGLGRVYDLLFSPRLHEGENQDTEE